MGINSVACRTAKELVGRCQCEADEFMAHHYRAMVCRDCEDFLKLAITAFDWTQHATRAFRAHSIQESESFVEGCDALRAVRNAWLQLATAVLDWGREQVDRGFSVSDLTQLEAYVVRMRHIASEEARLAEIAKKVPASQELSLIGIDPPREWLDEPTWNSD
jgi:hypothetical protein